MHTDRVLKTNVGLGSYLFVLPLVVVVVGGGASGGGFTNKYRTVPAVTVSLSLEVFSSTLARF